MTIITGVEIVLAAIAVAAVARRIAQSRVPVRRDDRPGRYQRRASARGDSWRH